MTFAFFEICPWDKFHFIALNYITPPQLRETLVRILNPYRNHGMKLRLVFTNDN